MRTRPFRIGAMRMIAPRPGMTGEIRYPTQDRLAGWPEGAKVRVIGGPPREIVVEDGDGRMAPFPHECIDVGCEFKDGDGRWFHESEARVLDALAAYVAKLESEKWNSATERDRQAVIASTRRRLARNGR